MTGVIFHSIISVSYTHLDVYKRQGLSICKILSEKFGGDIFLDNLPDRGAIITIKIKK